MALLSEAARQHRKKEALEILAAQASQGSVVDWPAVCAAFDRLLRSGSHDRSRTSQEPPPR
ncbi:MAG: hypothetical protein AB7O21_06540 [Gammaproteobacteria bacterium]